MGYCCWKGELSSRNLLLDHENPALFGEPQCGRLLWLFMIYRGVWTLFLLGSWMYDLVFDSVFYVIYLTNWSFMMVTLSTVLETISAILHQVQISRRPDEIYRYDSMPVLYKITWVFHNVSNSAALSVTILYWAVLYPVSHSPLTFTNVVTHTINTVYVLINSWITAIPTRLLHAWHGVVYGTLYGAFAVVYYAAGGVNESGHPYIYSVLDWDSNPALASGLVVMAVFVMLPIAHFMFFLIYKLRTLIFERCKCQRTSSVAPTEETSLDHEGKKEGCENKAFQDVD